MVRVCVDLSVVISKCEHEAERKLLHLWPGLKSLLLFTLDVMYHWLTADEVSLCKHWCLLLSTDGGGELLEGECEEDSLCGWRLSCVLIIYRGWSSSSLCIERLWLGLVAGRQSGARAPEESEEVSCSEIRSTVTQCPVHHPSCVLLWIWCSTISVSALLLLYTLTQKSHSKYFKIMCR